MRFCFGDYVLDPARRELLCKDEAVHVEPQVFDLLLHLIRNRARVVPRDELLSTVWQGRVVSESTLDSRITAVRRAVGDSGVRQRLIRTVVRRGVRFVGEVSEEPEPPSASPDAAGRATATLAARPVSPADGTGAGPMAATYGDVIAAFVGAHRGRLLENHGDDVIAGFPGTGEAVRAAVDFQRELNARNASLTDARRLRYRVGIEAGDIAPVGGGAPEARIAAATALAAAAEPGDICISANVRARIAGADDMAVVALGDIDTPNGARPIPAYQIDGKAPVAFRGPACNHGKPTVGVLPFLNMSGDQTQDYFADGVTEDILTALSKHRSLLVIARTSTFAFKGHGTDVRRVGADLGADYIVEGSVRRIGERVRITVQLVATDDGRHIWAERYDRGLQELFEVQDEITATIAARIEPEVASVERLRAGRKSPQSLRAWDYFHLGTNHFYKWTVSDNREAQRLFRHAIELDPELAQAHAWLSYAIVVSMLYFDAEPDNRRLGEAVSIARQSIDLDDRDALARFMYGRALLACKAYGDSLSELHMAVELNPGLAVAYCGLGDSLAYEGRFREAFGYFEKAIALSPHDPQRWAFYAYRALAHIFAQDFDQAVEWAQKATRIPNCHYWPFVHRVAALGHSQRGDELQSALAELLARKPESSCSLARARLFYVKNATHLDTYVEGLRRAGLPE